MKTTKKLFLASIGFALSIFSLAACGSNTLKKHVYVDGVSFSALQYTYEVGGQYKLEPIFDPIDATNQNVTWDIKPYSSTDPEYITIASDGTLTANKTGTGTVTVVTQESKYRPSCIVKVIDKIVKVASILLPSTSTVKQGKTLTLSPEILPSDATNKSVKWTSSDSSVAKVASNGTITGVKQGTATITATSVDSTELSASCVVTVTEPVAVTGVTLSSSSTTIKQGKTATLTATVAPSDAYDKTVTWSSSNSSAVSVDSNGIITGVTANSSAVITATTNDGGFTATCNVTVEEKPAADAWTVMLYICGADLESKNGLATSDIKEILSVSGQPEDVNIVIETGGASSWKSTYGISASKLERWHVENKSLVKDDSLTYESMGLTSTLQSFLEYGLGTYPADKTALILWNHGGGLQGVCYDEKKKDDSLLAKEVVSAVKGALKNCSMAGQKLEWIGYDACLMQVQDIAEMNSQYFKYMVASEESESGYGWDYDSWVDDLYAEKDTETILKAIVDGFIKDNGGVSSSSNNQTLSYLDLQYATEYMNAWEDMATQLRSTINSSNKDDFNELVDSCQSYADSDYEAFGLFDAKDFVNKLAKSSIFKPAVSYTNAVLTAHSKLVKYASCGKGAGNSYGLCMYWCINSEYKSYNPYSTTDDTHFSNWSYLSNTYCGSGSTSGSSDDWGDWGNWW